MKNLMKNPKKTKKRPKFSIEFKTAKLDVKKLKLIQNKIPNSRNPMQQWILK